MYLAGTEEGLIHKCSCSYNEQYLETYRGHKVSLILVDFGTVSPGIFERHIRCV